VKTMQLASLTPETTKIVLKHQTPLRLVENSIYI